MKTKKLIALLIAALMIMVIFAGCAGSKDDADDKVEDEKPAEEKKTDDKEADTKEEAAAALPDPGADTNNGRPFNLEKVKYDSRSDEYSTGINGTVLPIVDDNTAIVYWTSFSSTIMQTLDESEVYQELEIRTGIDVQFIYPPVGQETDNFNLRVVSDDLPHVFLQPPTYPGGIHKGIEDEVYLELTSYYDKGLMPNIKWFRESDETINADFVDDDGRLLYIPMTDINPSSPWSGLWVREDRVEKLGLEMPVTIDDWDTMLRAMQAEYGDYPLGLNIPTWYGVATNFAFASSYEAAYEWMQKDGNALYGPIEPGYKDFLTLLNTWYEDKVLDVDFATIDQATYNAKMANGQNSAMGMAYGDYGQAVMTGAALDPDYKLTAVIMPTSYDGQIIKLHQADSLVRGPSGFITTLTVEDGIDETVVKMQDYWYSQDGGDLFSLGVEGYTYEWGEDGEFHWIHPSLDNDEADFWTLFPKFKVHTGPYLRNSKAYDNDQGVLDCIVTWDSQSAEWNIPSNVSHTGDESVELNDIMTDINTYRDEMTLKFITGLEPLSGFDVFVETIKGMDIDRAVEIKTAAVQRYFAR